MSFRFVTLIVLAGIGLGGLAGCGSSGSSEPVSAPPPSVAPPSSGPPPSAGASIRPADPVPSGSAMALRGTIKDGVEAGCVLLATDSKTYLLVGGDRAALKSGAQVTVYGTPQPDLMTTCQQGTPFQVTRIEH
ncbi:hypothetical protein ABT297_35180 [Dactylosporangium sp. NPDC000555]|uniref:hypothetical protein n=1 Tax=Dactylosporangium sp. NPDC000555 TaxID=3154260 RepID=UPI0033279495